MISLALAIGMIFSLTQNASDRTWPKTNAPESHLMFPLYATPQAR